MVPCFCGVFKSNATYGPTMLGTRAGIDVEDLLKIILLLVVVWIALEVLGMILGTISWLLGPLQPILGLVILVLIVLWLLDRL